jgi:hypothetical protein
MRKADLRGLPVFVTLLRSLHWGSVSLRPAESPLAKRLARPGREHQELSWYGFD